MSTHWAIRYLGEPWIAKTHECGHFFVRVQREQFGITTEVIDADALSVLSCVRALAGDHPEFMNWPEVDRNEPREGDCLQMSHSKHPHHVGLWVDVDGGGVLHCVEGAGVVFSTRQALRTAGWNITAVRRHRSRL